MSLISIILHMGSGSINISLTYNGQPVTYNNVSVTYNEGS